MVKLEIRITHVAWRDGRPRFAPGPKLRRLGFKGEDLKREDGSWMDAQEAARWVEEKAREIAARRAAPRGREKPQKGGRHVTVEGLLGEWMATPRMAGEEEETGRRRVKAVRAATLRDYRQKERVLAAFDPEIYGAPAAAISKPVAYHLYERLWAARGLATARGVVATLSAAYSWGLRTGRLKGVALNPWQKLGMQTPDARIRAGTPAEIRHLIRAADIVGRPEIGDSVAMGVWTGQRQADRLGLVQTGRNEGRRVFRQGKTGAIVSIPEAPDLSDRLDAAMARRKDWTVRRLEVVVDEKTRRPFKADHYRHLFAQVRAAAVAGVKDAQGAWLVEPMESLANFRDQDLRDTAVTWLARAGCTIPEIASITGHEMATVTAILKHYLAMHEELADNAIAKAVAWYGGQQG